LHHIIDWDDVRYFVAVARGGLVRAAAAWRAGAPDPIRWIAKSNFGIPDWAREGEVPTTEIPFKTTDAEAQIVAVRQGLGMTTLPCFVGDADKLLVRVPGTALRIFGTLWLLTRARPAKRSADASSPSSYPAGSPRTRRFSRDCPIPTTDERQVADPSPRRRPLLTLLIATEMPQHEGARCGALSLLQQLHKFTVFSDGVRRRRRLIVQQHSERCCRCKCLDETAQKLVAGHRSQQQMEVGKQMHERDFVAAPLRIPLGVDSSGSRRGLPTAAMGGELTFPTALGWIGDQRHAAASQRWRNSAALSNGQDTRPGRAVAGYPSVTSASITSRSAVMTIPLVSGPR
jgi:hypothetical protein